MKTKILILSIAAALPATLTFAQDPGGPPPPRDGDREGGRRMDRGPQEPGRAPMPMPVPFLGALDTDDDGIISAGEIKNAPDSLAKLDRNGDGQLSPEEWRPAMPGGPREGRDREARGGGPRDGERKAGGQRDGDRPQGGPRDGERRTLGPRDGESPKAGPRDGEGQRPGRGDNNQPVGRPKPPEGDAPRAGERPPGDGGPRQIQTPPPLLEALDVNHDGTISADEIGKSPESLATLDKNNDGQLGPREYGPRPPQPPIPPQENRREGVPPEPKAGN